MKPMSVRLNRTAHNTTYVEIGAEDYTLSVQTVHGRPEELIELAEKAELEAARFNRRAKRLREASTHLADKRK